MNADPTIVTVFPLQRLARHARALEVDPAPLLRRAGVDPAILDDDQALVPIAHEAKAFRVFAETLEDPELALHLAEDSSPEEYGILGHLWRSHDTVLSALHGLSSYYNEMVAPARLDVEEGPETTVVRVSFAHHHDGISLTAEEVLAAVFVQSRRASRGDWHAVAVNLPDAEGDPDAYAAFFGVRPDTWGDTWSLTLRTDHLRAPLSTADPELLGHLREAAETHTRRRREAAESHIRRISLRGCIIDLDTGTVMRGAEAVPLTTKERTLLAYLAERPNEVVSKQEVERQVWGLGTKVLSHAPAVAVRRLRNKIEPDPRRPVNLVTVFGEGWRLVTDKAS